MSVQMVGPKKQDFWPRINILKEKKNLWIRQWIMVGQKVPKIAKNCQRFDVKKNFNRNPRFKICGKHVHLKVQIL